jgi:hypothetical protein
LENKNRAYFIFYDTAFSPTESILFNMSSGKCPVWCKSMVFLKKRGNQFDQDPKESCAIDSFLVLSRRKGCIIENKVGSIFIFQALSRTN